jgi:polar amino acid transport system substrate-binding protein
MQLKRAIFATLLVGALSSLAIAPAWARDTLADVKQRGKLIVGVKQDYKPYGFLDPSGKITGIEPELAADVAKRLGVALELVPVVASNRIQFVQQGRIDLMIATMTDTPERAQIIGIPKPDYYAAGVDIMAKKGAGFKAWEDLKGKTLCGIQGAFYNKSTQEQYGVQVTAFTGTTEALTALKNGSCIGFLYDDSFNIPRTRDPEWSAYETPLKSIEVKPWGVGVAKDDPKFQAFMSDVVKDWHRSGKLIELQKKYGLPDNDFLEKMHQQYAKAK